MFDALISQDFFIRRMRFVECNLNFIIEWMTISITNGNCVQWPHTGLWPFQLHTKVFRIHMMQHDRS